MVASMVEIKAGPARAMVYILGEKQTKAKWKVKKKKNRNGVKVKEIQESLFKNKMRPNNLSSSLSI